MQSKVFIFARYSPLYKMCRLCAGTNVGWRGEICFILFFSSPSSFSTLSFPPADTHTHTHTHTHSTELKRANQCLLMNVPILPEKSLHLYLVCRCSLSACFVIRSSLVWAVCKNAHSAIWWNLWSGFTYSEQRSDQNVKYRQQLQRTWLIHTQAVMCSDCTISLHLHTPCG